VIAGSGLFIFKRRQKVLHHDKRADP